MSEDTKVKKLEKPRKFTVTVVDTESGQIEHEVTSDVVILGAIQRKGKEDEFFCLYQGNLQGLNNLLSYMTFVVTGFINKSINHLKQVTEKKVPDKKVN